MHNDGFFQGLVPETLKVVQVGDDVVKLGLAISRDLDQLVPRDAGVDAKETEPGQEPDHGPNRLVKGDEQAVEAGKLPDRQEVLFQRALDHPIDSVLLPLRDIVGLLDRILDEPEEGDPLRRVVYALIRTDDPASCLQS